MKQVCSVANNSVSIFQYIYTVVDKFLFLRKENIVQNCESSWIFIGELQNYIVTSQKFINTNR